jgi:hypothetical protein
MVGGMFGMRVHEWGRPYNRKLLCGDWFGFGWQRRGCGGAVAWGEGIPMEGSGLFGDIFVCFLVVVSDWDRVLCLDWVFVCLSLMVDRW